MLRNRRSGCVNGARRRTREQEVTTSGLKCSYSAAVAFAKAIRLPPLCRPYPLQLQVPPTADSSSPHDRSM
jgi:hypothetical protein